MRYEYSYLEKVFLWILQIIAAIILFIASYMKFIFSPDIVEVFMALGMQGFGIIFIGVIEFISALMLLSFRYSVIGAFIAFGVMLGVMIAHFTVLGINFGLLLGVTVILISFLIILIRKKELPLIGKYL